MSFGTHDAARACARGAPLSAGIGYRGEVRRSLLIAIVACTPAPVATTTFAVPGLGLTIEMPAGTTAEFAADGATFTTRPGARVPRRIDIRGRPAPAGDETRRLTADIEVAYSVELGGGGSGGEASVLTGALRVGERRYAVTCDDQGEPPEPTWCLAWLATARLAPP